MIKQKSALILGMLAIAMPGIALAQDQDGGWFSNFNYSFGGFLRLESAFSTSKDENPFNQNGNPYNDVTINRQAYTPPALVPAILPILGQPAGSILTPNWSSLPVPALLAFDAQAPAVRDVRSQDSLLNYGVIRGEVEGTIQLTESLSLIGRLRALYSPTDVYDYSFDGGSLDGIQGGMTGGDPALYRREPNYFDYRVEGGGNPNPLEWAGAEYQVYFPALFLQYNEGPLNVRIGNQQIAWGQAIFFRVLDIPNGLDLRRHSILDYAQEEFADKRVPSLGIRATYQATDSILVDAFAQKFQPTIFGNPNTPYNVIASQFVVHDLYKEGGYDDEISYGMRLKADFGQYGFQLMAARRYNPDGVFRWTKSGVNKNLPNNLGSLGALVNSAYAIRQDRTYDSTGEALANSPFEVGPGGVYSGREFMYYGHLTRLDSFGGLNSAIEEFDGAQQLFATPVDNMQDGLRELDTFFIAAGGSMRGHIAREYFEEDVYGVGVNYITEGEPGGWLDQLIINVEASYTPDKTFTNTTLSRDYLKEDAWVGALVMEKYQRFSQEFPATYLVLQYMYRNADDMVGRSLKGYGGSNNVDGALPTRPDGVSNAQYIAFALQQPFPQDIYRIGFAALYDIRGGILLQPGIKWKPRGDITLEAFYSHLDGGLSGNPNDNLISTLDFADELTVRLSYQF